MVTITYKEDELVLAYHGALIYEAKILKIDKNDDIISYFLHYQGWNKKWDEWVGPERIMKDNKQNREKQTEAKNKVKLNKNNNSSNNTTNNKIKKENDNEEMKSKNKNKNESIKNKNSRYANTVIKKRNLINANNNKCKAEEILKRIKIDRQNHTEIGCIDDDDDNSVMIKNNNFTNMDSIVPITLKKQLINDWKFVTKKPYRIISLPKKPNVTEIIDMYLNEKKKDITRKITTCNGIQREMANITEIMFGIQDYFNRSLGSLLLYQNERSQYNKYIQENEEVKPCDYYGGEHLLRLFVRLPYILSCTDVTSSEAKDIEMHLADFLKFLKKNADSYFSKKYTEIVDIDAEIKEETNTQVKNNEKETEQPPSSNGHQDDNNNVLDNIDDKINNLKKEKNIESNGIPEKENDVNNENASSEKIK